MANVFVSYARRDREQVLGLVSALEHEGLSVWWDPNLVPGKRFRDIIARELAAADSVVVVWTAASIQSDYVQDEAEEARERGVLVPTTLEPVKPPAGFRQVQAADLRQWTGSNQHPEFRMLLRAVRTLVEAARADDASEARAESPAPERAPPASSPAGAATPPPPTVSSSAQRPTLSQPTAQPTGASSAAAAPAASAEAPPSAPAPHEVPFLPRLFDLFARPAVWLTGAALVAASGLEVGFGLAGTAAAMMIWAGAMAQAGVGVGFGPNRKTMVMVISLGVTLIVAASAHSPKGAISAILTGGAVFAGVTTITMASGRGARRRSAPNRATRAAHRAYREEFRDYGEEIKREVLEGLRSRRARRRKSDTAPER